MMALLYPPAGSARMAVGGFPVVFAFEAHRANALG